MPATGTTPRPRIRLATCALAVLLGGCALKPVAGGSPAGGSAASAYRGETALAAGLRQYQAGDYPASSKNLHSALALGLASDDRVTAHKYLAFIHCASGRERACREEFRKALDIDPALELTTAEAGHPAWGPVFRSLKAAR